jgi:hypothetical protein
MEYSDRIDQDDDRQADEYNGIIQIERVTANLMEIELHEQTQEEEVPAWKLNKVSCWTKSGCGVLTSASCLQSRKWRVSYSKMKT